jgi:hypothetical protein
MMTVALELGKDEDEIGHWQLSKLLRWMAFFRIRDEEQAKAIEKARRRNK